jgi:hypothetical protein
MLLVKSSDATLNTRDYIRNCYLPTYSKACLTSMLNFVVNLLENERDPRQDQ